MKMMKKIYVQYAMIIHLNLRAFSQSKSIKVKSKYLLLNKTLKWVPK